MTMPTDHFIQLRELNFHYRDWQGSGRPLVLLHGLASNARFWDLAAPYLTHQFHALALDQRGHGASAKPDEGYDFPSVARDMERFVRSLGLERPIIVGHSWGGNVAVQIAADYPGLASGVVCIDGGTIEPSSVAGATLEETLKRLTPPDFVALNLTWDQLLERAANWGTAAVWGDKQVDFLRANFLITEDGKIRPQLTRERHMRIIRAIWEQKVSNLYSLVSCPVLLMPARSNSEQTSRATAPSNTKEACIARATQLLNRHRLVWMENAIHDVPVQQPAQVADAIIQAARDGLFDDPA